MYEDAIIQCVDASGAPYGIRFSEIAHGDRPAAGCLIALSRGQRAPARVRRELREKLGLGGSSLAEFAAAHPLPTIEERRLEFIAAAGKRGSARTKSRWPRRLGLTLGPRSPATTRRLMRAFPAEYVRRERHFGGRAMLVPQPQQSLHEERRVILGRSRAPARGWRARPIDPRRAGAGGDCGCIRPREGNRSIARRIERAGAPREHRRAARPARACVLRRQVEALWRARARRLRAQPVPRSAVFAWRRGPR